jgi:hypothetical protein
VLLHVQGAYRGSVPAAHLGCKFTRVAAWLSASQHVLCSGLSHDVARSGVMNGPAWHAHCLEALQSRAGCIVPCRLLHVCMYVCMYACLYACSIMLSPCCASPVVHPISGGWPFLLYMWQRARGLCMLWRVCCVCVFQDRADALGGSMHSLCTH